MSQVEEKSRMTPDINLGSPHAYTFMFICTRAHTCLQACKHTYAHITHTYIHTYMKMKKNVLSQVIWKNFMTDIVGVQYNIFGETCMTSPSILPVEYSCSHSPH